MRISEAAVLPLLLAACSPNPSGTPAVAQGDDLIDCAVSGAASLTHACAVERSVQDGAPMLVVRHPDGGFRRFKVLDGGKSIEPADGADAVAIASNATGLDVSVNGDHYRFPATLLTNAGR